MAEQSARREALADLLVRRATEGLTPTAEARLERLLDLFPETEASAYDRAAAAVWLAASGGARAAMPADLAARILARAGSANDGDR